MSSGTYRVYGDSTPNPDVRQAAGLNYLFIYRLEVLYRTKLRYVHRRNCNRTRGKAWFKVMEMTAGNFNVDRRMDTPGDGRQYIVSASDVAFLPGTDGCYHQRKGPP